MLIDFDISAWGYRAFDICLFFSNMPEWPSANEIDGFLDAYLFVYNENSPIESSKEMLMTEIKFHTPFVLMGQMLWDQSLWISLKTTQIDAYFISRNNE